MTIFETKARVIATGLVQTHAMDPAIVQAGAEGAPGPFIQFLMQLLQQLLPMLLTCIPKPATPAATNTAMKSLGLLQTFIMRRHIRREINDQQGEAYLFTPLLVETKKMMAACTDDEVGSALNEIA